MSACLMLHGLGDPSLHVGEEEKPYWVSEATFAGILDLVQTTPARLTIDDGNASDVATALPALVGAGLTATFFIPSDRIGTAHYVSETDVRALHAAGMEIGSHGCAHLRWTDTPDAEIARDVTRSIERLSAIIGEPVRSVAIPFGHCDRRVLGVLRYLGVGRVYSSFRGPELNDAWLVRRDCVMGDMTLADVNALLTAQPTVVEATLTFLRIWRHAGRAAVLKA
jgi:peptidoglycan/xylan/chitin deacetylase (PgdA/CDA1 family)